MNHLVSVRTNIMYVKNKESGEYNRFQELIFLVDKAQYIRTNDNDIIRQIEIEEQRFIVSDKAFDELIKILEKLRNAEESDLI